MRVSVPCCPTLASSWNQTSTGLPVACSPSASLARAAKFFKSFLGRGIGLRVLWANGETPEVQSPQQLTHAAFVQGDAKLSGYAVTQIGAPEPHDAVASEIGALFDPGCKLALLDPA
jgi:hypothetical protein